jgi:hypothetical protein
MAVIRRHVPRPRITIEQAVELFLEDQRARVPGRVHAEYEELLEDLKEGLNRQGVDSLSPEEWAYFQSQPRRSFCKVFGPGKLLAEARGRLKSRTWGTTTLATTSDVHLKGLVRRLALWLRRNDGIIVSRESA